MEEKWLLIKIHKMEIENEKLTSMTIEEYDKKIMELDREMAEKKANRALLVQKRFGKLPSINDA